MHTTARYFIKTAFLFFGLGLLSGLYMYSAKQFGWFIPPNLVSAHTHVILLGGMLMMILGVAVWFFPRPKPEDTRYKPRLVIALYWVFSGSTLVRFVAEVSIGISHNANLGLIGLLMAFTQVVSVILLIYLLWERIRPTGSQIREAKGERF